MKLNDRSKIITLIDKGSHLGVCTELVQEIRCLRPEVAVEPHPNCSTMSVVYLREGVGE